MRQARNVRSPRQGFTLIELLVVIAIIAILTGLLLGGVMKVLGVPVRVQTTSEISQLGGAIAQFEQDFKVEYIPSYFVLREDAYDLTRPDHRAAFGYLTKLFGKNIFQTGTSTLKAGIDWNGNGTPNQAGDMVLTGEQCLVFFLGGIPRGGQCTGFAKDPSNPTAAGGARSGPYYQFKATRLTAGTNGFFMYQDPYSPRSASGVTTTYYAYFSANRSGGSYVYVNGSNVTVTNTSAQSATYYNDSTGNPVNPHGYQIICAGLDGLFGSVASNPPVIWNSLGTTSPHGVDDQANFARGLVGAVN